MLAHSITKTNITLNTDKYVTVIATQHAVNQSSEYKCTLCRDCICHSDCCLFLCQSELALLALSNPTYFIINLFALVCISK